MSRENHGVGKHREYACSHILSLLPYCTGHTDQPGQCTRVLQKAMGSRRQGLRVRWGGPQTERDTCEMRQAPQPNKGLAV